MSIVGLDLGTTKLRAAVLANGVATLVGDGTGATSIPAVVGMHQGRVHVGEPAARLYEADPAAAAWGGKGLLGEGQVALGGYAKDKKNRLKALPWARCCITCQRLMEQSAERL